MVEARLARERDARRRRNLETVLAHMRAEAAPDLEALMATVAENAHYHAWGTDDPLTTFGGAGVTGFNIYSMIVAVIGAIVVLIIYHAITGRGRTTT